MSMGAVFKLIANDGKADRMIMATKLLNQRIRDVMCARKQAGKSDITPTLVDLERTHILYVNAHFKPFAAIGYEYNKVRPQSGNPTLGGGVTFSIPQFGDFFFDMVCRTRLGQCIANVGLTPRQTLGSVNNPATFPFNGTNPDGTSAPGVFYDLVDAFGAFVVSGVDSNGSPTQAQYRNYVRYCEYPGHRLFNLVKFDVNGNPLDQYDSMIPVMLEKFCVCPHKRIGHDRLIGQEVPMQCYSGLQSGVVSDSDKLTPQGISKANSLQSNQTVGLFNRANIYNHDLNTLTATNQTGVANMNLINGPQVDISRELKQVVNGPQTPKPVQAPLEIWNKLRFWFNDDVRLSIASVSIPFGQRFISIDLTQQSNLVYEFPSIYLRTTRDSLSSATAHEPLDSQYVRKTTFTPIFQRFGITDVSVEKMELYINNIFVNPEIHDIYIKRIGFSLIRVYRQHSQRCNQDTGDEKLLSQIKWPIEYMFVGLRPAWNIKDVITGSNGNVSDGNPNVWRDWHRLTRIVTANSDKPDLSELPTSVDGPATQNAVSSSWFGKVIPDQYYLPVPTVDSLTLTSHGITIFDQFSDLFFNQYLPYQYGGPSIVTPDDPGALFVNMALFPRSYQPSGHLNISRARETYIRWTTSYISASTSADLIVVAVAINFLLITDGSAVLRYST